MIEDYLLVPGPRRWCAKLGRLLGRKDLVLELASARSLSRQEMVSVERRKMDIVGMDDFSKLLCVVGRIAY